MRGDMSPCPRCTGRPRTITGYDPTTQSAGVPPQPFDLTADYGSFGNYYDDAPSVINAGPWILASIEQWIPKSYRHKVVTMIRLFEDRISFGWTYFGSKLHPKVQVSEHALQVERETRRVKAIHALRIEHERKTRERMVDAAVEAYCSSKLRLRDIEPIEGPVGEVIDLMAEDAVDQLERHDNEASDD